jgi:hypothetical protein
MNARLNEDSVDEVMAQWFENSYDCSVCGETWTDEWSCMCNDRCPECNIETEPTSSIDLSRSLIREDYIGAARLLSRKSGETPAMVTDEDAEAYAEAVLEGGEHRFCPPRWQREKA